MDNKYWGEQTYKRLQMQNVTGGPNTELLREIVYQAYPGWEAGFRGDEQKADEVLGVLLLYLAQTQRHLLEWALEETKNNK